MSRVPVLFVLGSNLVGREVVSCLIWCSWCDGLGEFVITGILFGAILDDDVETCLWRLKKAGREV